MTKLLLLCCVLLLAVAGRAGNPPVQTLGEVQKPTISLTFDDGSVDDMPGYALERWNAMLLEHLRQHRVRAILFSTGNNKLGERGQYVLSSWSDAGHRIGNHTMTHPNCSRLELAAFERELLANDSIVRAFTGFIPLFRFPYLKEGNTRERIDSMRQCLSRYGYRNGAVTVDASDWYINSRLVHRLKENPAADVSRFRAYYVEHLYNRAVFYESLAYDLTGRHICHNLLLHHNLAAALFAGDVIQYFKDKGWNVIDADKAYEDTVYNTTTSVVPAGESLIWSMARQSGRFEHVLRYPAEDSRYEKAAMDSLGL